MKVDKFLCLFHVTGFIVFQVLVDISFCLFHRDIPYPALSSEVSHVRQSLDGSCWKSPHRLSWCDFNGIAFPSISEIPFIPRTNYSDSIRPFPLALVKREHLEKAQGFFPFTSNLNFNYLKNSIVSHLNESWKHFSSLASVPFSVLITKYAFSTSSDWKSLKASFGALHWGVLLLCHCTIEREMSDNWA